MGLEDSGAIFAEAIVILNRSYRFGLGNGVCEQPFIVSLWLDGNIILYI